MKKKLESRIEENRVCRSLNVGLVGSEVNRKGCLEFGGEIQPYNLRHITTAPPLSSCLMLISFRYRQVESSAEAWSWCPVDYWAAEVGEAEFFVKYR